MADYSTTREAVGSAVPTDAVETEWDDSGPLISPPQVRSLHLFGIPLVSALRNPLTKRPDVVDDPLIDQHIKEAISLVEAEAGIEIFARQHEERQAYDRQLQQAFGYAVLRHRPVRSVEELSIVSSDGKNIWKVPLAWLERGYMHRGQIGMMPFAVSSQSGVTIPLTAPVGIGLLPAVFRFNWVPALWTCKYTTGFKDGKIPRIVNHLIGTVAAMEILSMLAVTYAQTQSSSLGIDGLSQSASTPGGQIFTTRLQQLGEKRKWLVSRIKHMLGLGLFVDNI